MKEKIPIDKIDDWKLKNKMKQTMEQFKNIPGLITKDIKPRKKKKQLKKLWAHVMKELSQVPQNIGEIFSKTIIMNMLFHEINLISGNDFKNQKLAIGGIVPKQDPGAIVGEGSMVTLSPGNYSALLEYGNPIKAKKIIKKGELVKSDKVIEIKLGGKTILKGVKHVSK
jgi:hypothetical protein